MVRGDKTERLTIRISPDEEAMLEDLARAANAAETDVVRQLIRAAHERQFPKMNPGAEIAATTRALIHDVGNAVHYTARNTADRMRVPLGAVKGALAKLERKRILECVETHDDLDETWELLVPLDRALALASEGGADLDEPIFKQVLSFDLHVDAKGVARFAAVDPFTRGRLDADGKRAAGDAALEVLRACQRAKVTTTDIAHGLQRELRKRFPHATVDVYHAPRTGVTVSSLQLEY